MIRSKLEPNDSAILLVAYNVAGSLCPPPNACPPLVCNSSNVVIPNAPIVVVLPDANLIGVDFIDSGITAELLINPDSESINDGSIGPDTPAIGCPVTGLTCPDCCLLSSSKLPLIAFEYLVAIVPKPSASAFPVLRYLIAPPAP